MCNNVKNILKYALSYCTCNYMAFVLATVMYFSQINIEIIKYLLISYDSFCSLVLNPYLF